jgi:hypothetical protein
MPAARLAPEPLPAAAQLVEPVSARAMPHAAVPAPQLIEAAPVHRGSPALAMATPVRPVRMTPRGAHVMSLAVEGALPRSVVERAVARAMPAVQSCRLGNPVVARFTIDDSRRATAVQTASPCIAQALAHLRTEVAPDTGDAAVVLKLGGG